MNTLDGDTFIKDGHLIMAANKIITPARSREDEIAAETFIDWIPLTQFRYHDTGGQSLPATGGNDDLGIYHGTYGTEPFYLSTGDVMGLNSTRYARALWKLKDTYVDGSQPSIIALVACRTNTCSVSCTFDVEVYTSDNDFTMTQRLASSPVSMNSTTFSTKTFSLSSYSSLTPESELDIRIAVDFEDASGSGARIPTILGVGISQSCKGG